MSTWFDLCKMDVSELMLKRLRCSCPICDKEMFYPEISSMIGFEIDCSNRCFNIDFWKRVVIDDRLNRVGENNHPGYFEIRIFDKLEYSHTGRHKYRLNDELQYVYDRINYWREDYKYVAEILERG